MNKSRIVLGTILLVVMTAMASADVARPSVVKAKACCTGSACCTGGSCCQ